MRTKRKIAGLLVLTMILSMLSIGCQKKDVESSMDMGKAIAKFLEVDKVEICSTRTIDRYSYVCFYYEGDAKEKGGYSYAAFRRSATGEYVLEFAQMPSKLIAMADGIGGAYYDDHMILVSSNENLDLIKVSGEIKEEAKVNTTPFIYVINIFQGEETAKKVSCTFYDKNQDQIR